MAKNSWKVFSDEEIKAAKDHYATLKNQADEMSFSDDDSRLKFIKEGLENFTEQELLILAAMTLTEKL